MKTFLHINSRVPCAVSLNGRLAGKTSPDRFIHAESDGDEEILLTASPINADTVSGEKILPAAAAVFVRGGYVQTESAAVQTVSLPGRHYELTIINEAVYSSVPAAAIKQENFSVNGERHIVTLLQDAHKQLVCEGGGRLFTYILPKTFDVNNLTAKTIGGAAVITAHGKTCDGEYLAVIVYDGGYAVNLNSLCDKAEFEGDKIQTLTRLNDIAQRGAVITYTFNSSLKRYEISDHYAVYLLNAPKKPGHNALIPFALFQSIKAGDYREARTFLSGPLNADIPDDNALSAYFDGFDLIEENKYYPDLPFCAVLKPSGPKAAAKLLIYALDNQEKIDDLKII